MASSVLVGGKEVTTARDRGGTGLGLAIVRALIAAHGGTIALVPSARGAAFQIGLPVR